MTSSLLTKYVCMYSLFCVVTKLFRTNVIINSNKFKTNNQMHVLDQKPDQLQIYYWKSDCIRILCSDLN